MSYSVEVKIEETPICGCDCLNLQYEQVYLVILEKETNLKDDFLCWLRKKLEAKCARQQIQSNL